MVQSCCAYNCVERSKRGSDVSFHLFPQDLILKSKWVVAMRRENFKPSKHSRICSKHFTSDSFDTSGWSSRKHLKNDAVPQIFDFPIHLIKKITTRKPPAKRNLLVKTEDTNEKEEILCIAPSLEPPVKKRRTFYIGDFKEPGSSKSDQHYRCTVQKVLNKKQKQIKALQQRNRRLTKKVLNLKSLLDHLKQQRFIDEESSLKLSDTIPVSTKTILSQLLKSKRNKVYPPQLKSFALTLNFYSPKAYVYVRTTFPNMLPHPRTLQKWYETVACGPGFHAESIKILKQKVLQLKEKGKTCICSLMVDEMAIHKKIEWDGKKFLGYVDFGCELQSDSVAEAKEAIVFLINSVNDRWKLPVGYFLISGISGIQKSNLITMCLKMLHEAGVTITSLTFDGVATNISMANYLGADLSINSSRTYFPHPITKQPIYVLLDPPHMLKLIRNTLGTYKILFDGNDEPIQWNYFEKLVDAQEKEGLHLATKITRRHINWFKEKMKVKLAAQTFSLSVAKAMCYLRETQYSEDFKDSKATEKFVIFINDVFDILNSRNLLAKHYKASLQQYNKNLIFSKINKSIKYITSLKCTKSGEPLYLSQRKTGFIGIIISLKSYMGIWKQHVEIDGGLKYLSAYKLCQDHLEVFFSAIRSHGGYNNNPTARQFQAAYKRLLMHTGVTASSQANCIEQMPSIILAMSTTKTKINTFDQQLINNNEEIDDQDLVLSNLSYSKNLSLYVSDVVEYIAGFVVKTVKKQIDCDICLTAIQSDKLHSTLIIGKNYSTVKQCLIQPSKDVIHICKVAEREIRITEDTNKLTEKNLISKLIISIMYNVRGSVFDAYKEHMYDHDVECNHLTNLIKIISHCYCSLRLYHQAETLNTNSNRVRSRLTKTILFSGQ